MKARATILCTVLQKYTVYESGGFKPVSFTMNSLNIKYHTPGLLVTSYVHWSLHMFVHWSLHMFIGHFICSLVNSYVHWSLHCFLIAPYVHWSLSLLVTPYVPYFFFTLSVSGRCNFQVINV